MLLNWFEPIYKYQAQVQGTTSLQSSLIFALSQAISMATTESGSQDEECSIPSSHNKSTTHLVLCLGNVVINAYSKSTFAICYDREMALAPHGPLVCPSTTVTHSCQKRTCAYLDEEATCQLFEEMPNVTKLELLCAEDEFTDGRIDGNLSDSVVALVEHWADSLVTLRLWFQFGPNNLTELVAAINSLPALQNLTLEIVEKGSDTVEVPIDLPILPKLDEFYFCYPILTEQFIESMAKHANTNGKLMRVGLRTSKGISEEQLVMLQRLAPVLSTRFVHLPEVHRPFSTDKLKLFFGDFRSLTSLDIDCAELSLVALVNCLSPLASLIYLRLLNAFAHLEHPLASEDNIPTEQIAQLSSVLGLTLELFAPSHLELESKQWGWMFPSVQEIKVTNHNTNCFLCDQASLLGLSKSSTDIKIKCIRKLMQPLKQCAKLKSTAPVDIVTGGTDQNQ